MSSAPRKVLVTGANGFVGSALTTALCNNKFDVRRFVHHHSGAGTAGDDVIFGDLSDATIWNRALQDIDIVIHLAARTHVMVDTLANPLDEYRRVNVLGTRVLAAAAAKAGVRRFVFMSSIKVNGEKTDCAPFTEQDTPHPEDSYGISKWEAEQTLHDLIAGSTMQSVVLRAPLIYGAGAKGNLLQLMRAVDRGVPLPFSSIRNRRSLLHIKNLIDAIVLCMDHPAASNMTYLLADDEGVSTPDLIRGIASALGKTARLFPCHPELLKITCAAIGQLGVANRLSVSLQIDSRKIRRELNWHPRHNMMNGLREMAQSLR